MGRAPPRRSLPRPRLLLRLFPLQRLHVLSRQVQMLANLVRARERLLIHARPDLGAVHRHALQRDQLLHRQQPQYLREQILQGRPVLDPEV